MIRMIRSKLDFGFDLIQKFGHCHQVDAADLEVKRAEEARRENSWPNVLTLRIRTQLQNNIMILKQLQDCMQLSDIGTMLQYSQFLAKLPLIDRY